MKSRAKQLHKDLVETYGGLISDIDRKINSGVPIPDCLAKTMLDVRDKEGLDDLDMAILASAFMIGGVETVRSVYHMEICSNVNRLLQLCNGLQR